jgi:hypothetical protein
LHESRREGFWEGNYDVSNAATLRICGPFMVTSGNQGPRKWWGSAFITIVVIDHNMVTISENGAILVGGTRLWSREIVRGNATYESDPSEETCDAGAL